ncbi:MAG: 50S ribosomal protein L11 methyltransferase [Bacteroidales bacterium]|nr:50S ribosomal protein L11 methyltransferase [Bacteroidales bacterium]
MSTDYIEVKIKFNPVFPWKDVFTSHLSEMGADSFMDGDTEDELWAYIPEKEYKPAELETLLKHHDYPVQLQHECKKIVSRDWNAEWEAHFQPVSIDGQCYVRAPFHLPRPDMTYDIIIEPKMSFGTAHHETTFLMISYLLQETVQEKRVLDMGAGTGILAILASKKGARNVVSIDNDEWAYQNHIENNRYNQVQNITVILGDASSIPREPFDLICANINRNILLNDLPFYVKALKKNGILLLSGFYAGNDLSLLQKKCSEENLYFVDFKEKNSWVSAKFCK